MANRFTEFVSRFDPMDAIAKSVPWTAPIPSAYFVARSGMEHLSLPLPVAIIVAAIIETLGLATTHVALTCYDWNVRKRKSDPSAPTWIGVALAGVYVTSTLLLVVFLEVWPFLSTYAPALFPALAVVGALNLAVLYQHKQRMLAVDEDKAEAKQRRLERKQESAKKQPEPVMPTVVAGVKDWRSIVATGGLDHLNGDREKLDAATVAEILIQKGYLLPKERTLQLWAQETREAL